MNYQKILPLMAMVILSFVLMTVNVNAADLSACSSSLDNVVISFYLLDGQGNIIVSDTLTNRGSISQTKSYPLADNTYTVEAIFTSFDGDAKFKVNEIITKLLAEGESEFISNNLAIRFQSTTCVLAQLSCTDSDGGMNLVSKGTVKVVNTQTQESKTLTDECFPNSQNEVVEHYCVNGRAEARDLMECSAGKTCRDGACVTPTTASVCGNGIIEVGEQCDGNNLGRFGSCQDYDSLYTGGTLFCSSSCSISTSSCTTAQSSCTDSDNGVNLAVKGNVKTPTTAADQPTGMLTDTCLNGGTTQVIEYTCTNGREDSNIYNCPPGTTCQNGACTAAQSTCRDTDGGKNYFVSGKIYYPIGTYISESPDVCDGDAVYENYCESDASERLTPHGERFVCPNGCSDGACINISFQRTCIDSDNSPNYLSDQYVSINFPDGPDKYVKGNTKGVLYGETLLRNFPDTCTTTGQLNENYCNNNYLTYLSLNCLYGCKDGACIRNASTLEKCTDSDGGINLQKRGETLGVNAPGGPKMQYDTCLSETQIREYSCLNDNENVGTYTCPTGTICSDGACKVNTTQSCRERPACLDSTPRCLMAEPTEGWCPKKSPVCTDSDGGVNLGIKGETLGVNAPGGPKMQYDTCLNLMQIREYFCTNNNEDVNTYNCPTGTTCKEGACITTTQATCADSDNGVNLGIRGTVTTPTTSLTDSCIYGDQTQITEYICVNGEDSSNNYACPSGTICSDGACKVNTTQSCRDRPACLDSTPRCLMAEPTEGWCPKKEVECTTNSDCPPIQCIRAPCTQYQCINNQCVLESYNNNNVCGDGICSSSEKETCEIDCGSNIINADSTQESSKPIQIVPYLESNRIEIKEGDTIVETTTPVRLQEGKIIFQDSGREATVLPEQANSIAETQLRLKDSLLELRDEEVPVYYIDGNREIRFLGLFRMNMRVNARINAANGNLIDENTPWWDFMAIDSTE